MGQYVDEAVSSVLAQTFTDFEIILVNDGSTEQATLELLQSYERPHTRVVHTPNQGLPAARNHGIRLATGTYIGCLDADDKYHPQFLEKTIRILETDTDRRYGFVTTWVQAFEGGSFQWETSDYNVPALLENNVVHVGSVFRREAWEAVGGYNTDKGLYGYEDWNFWISLVEKGYQWACLHEALFYYRIRENSMLATSNQMRPELVRCIFDYHRDLYQQYAREVIYLKETRIQALYREKAVLQATGSLNTKDRINNPIKKNQHISGVRVVATRLFQKLKSLANATG